MITDGKFFAFKTKIGLAPSSEGIGPITDWHAGGGDFVVVLGN